VSLKRYRYTSKEKDEETGLYYHGARYYACWLARWTAADPAGLIDGPNRYQYVRSSPIALLDPSGKQPFLKMPRAKGISFELGEEKYRTDTSKEHIWAAANVTIDQIQADWREHFGMATESYTEKGLFSGELKAITIYEASKQKSDQVVKEFEAGLETKIRAAAAGSGVSDRDLTIRIQNAKEAAAKVREYIRSRIFEGQTVELQTQIKAPGEGKGATKTLVGLETAEPHQMVVGALRFVGQEAREMYMNPFTFFARSESESRFAYAGQASSAAARATLGPGMQLLHELEHGSRDKIVGGRVASGEKLQQEIDISNDVDEATKDLPSLLPRSGYGGGAGTKEKINSDKDWVLYPDKAVLTTGVLPSVRPDPNKAPYSSKYR
jgi:RHS repeat-associated protein